MTTYRTRAVATFLVAAVLATVAACGSGATSGNEGSGASGADTAAFNNKIATLIATATAAQANRPPTEGPKAQPGKKLFVVPCAMIANGCAAAARSAQAAGKAMGWDVTLIDPAGDPTKQNNAIDTAVAQKADGIFIASIDAKTIKASLARAKSAGTKVVCFACSDPDGEFDALVPDAPRDAYDSGYLAMAGLYEATGKDLKVVMVNGPEYGISTEKLGRQAGAEAFVDECRKAGGRCELVASSDVLTANFTTTVPGQIVSTFRQHPDANAMWIFADPVLQFIYPAVEKAGIKVKIGGIDPTTFNYDLLRKDKEQASVSPDLTWVGYAGIDDLNRMFAGQQSVEEGVKGKLITPKNVPADGDFEGDFDVVPLYKKLWGLNG